MASTWWRKEIKKERVKHVVSKAAWTHGLFASNGGDGSDERCLARGHTNLRRTGDKFESLRTIIVQVCYVRGIPAHIKRRNAGTKSAAPSHTDEILGVWIPEHALNIGSSAAKLSV